jgi:ATP-binding cassette, subfamily C, bacterial
MKPVFVQQQSEEDCGAACIAAIAKYYGLNLRLERVRQAVGTQATGTNLLGLKQGAEALGFKARTGVFAPVVLDRINEVEPLPMIIHWQGYHWVVLYGKQGNKYIIADPGVGIRYLSKNKVAKAWEDRVALLLEPDPETFANQTSDRVSGFANFLQRAWIYRGILSQVLLLNLVLGLLALASPFWLQILTDDVLVRGDTKLLASISIAVIVMTLISNLLDFVQSHLIANFAQRLELGLALEFGRQILRLPLSYYETRRSGEIVSRLQDVQEINQLISQVVISIPSQFFIAAVSFGFMLFYSWKLTIAAVICGVLMTLSTLIFYSRLQQKTLDVLVTEAENQGVLVETFKGAMTLKTTNAFSEFWEEFQRRFGRFANLSLNTIHIAIINHIFSGTVVSVGGIGLLWFGGTLVTNPAENLSIGQLLAFKAMNDNFLALISTMVNFADEFTRVKAATQRLTEVIEATPEGRNEQNKPIVRIDDDAEIICQNLNFHYPGRLELLNNFSVTIPGGEVIALIGKSGCGKSSLVKLITRLYQPQSGNIQIGDYNIQSISLDCLRSQVVLVPQEAHFWSRTIVENFRLGDPALSFDRIVRACKITQAHDFINELPENYHTILGEFGSNLSGGQRQRLAIARAIVNDPPILILDESTAGLDPQSESQLLDRLLEHRQGKTTILISHRPRVIQRANWILYLENGEVNLSDFKQKLMKISGDHLDFLD